MTPTHLALAAAALAVTGTAQAAAPGPDATVDGAYQPKTKRVCVSASALEPSELERIGDNPRPCLSRSAWNRIGIYFNRPSVSVRGDAS